MKKVSHVHAKRGWVQPWVLLAVLGEAGSSRTTQLLPTSMAVGSLLSHNFSAKNYFYPCSSWPSAAGTTLRDEKFAVVFLAHPGKWVLGWHCWEQQGLQCWCLVSFCEHSVTLVLVWNLASWFPPQIGQLQGGLGQDSTISKVHTDQSAAILCSLSLLGLYVVLHAEIQGSLKIISISHVIPNSTI